jgi:hypothetical protein
VFPIAVGEFSELVAGLFNAQVAEVYVRLLDEANEPEPVSAATMHRYLTDAIRETARWFPVSIQSRFMEAADRLAAELFGGQVVFPNRRRAESAIVS